MEKLGKYEVTHLSEHAKTFQGTKQKVRGRNISDTLFSFSYNKVQYSL